MRIGIVSNLPSETDALLQAVALKPDLQVIWIGKNGPEAVALCSKEMPDIVLLGLLAGMDAVDVTKRLMACAPCSIVIVTGSVQTNAARVFEAMGHGALDVVDMPASGTGSLQDRAAPLLAKIAIVARLIGDKDATRRAPPSMIAASSAILQNPLIVIGASAGGPAALAAVLRGLPKDFPAAMVVVQHVEAQFAGGMADWLSQQSALPVTVAKEGECPAVGKVLLAGTSDHLALMSANRLGYTPEPREYIHRPSIDVFFVSVSLLYPGDVVGVLLTGMGRDGAQGLKALRNRGHHTIAQDRATSAVYGMPKEAAALNAAVDILPMEQIAPRLITVVMGKS